MNEQSKKEMAKALWLEINRAIINSNRVRDSLNSMKEKGILDYLCEHDFLLDGKKLIEQLLNDPCQLDKPARSERQESLKKSIDLFLGEQGQALPVVESTLFPKGFFSNN
jgi:hypothetical protein